MSAFLRRLHNLKWLPSACFCLILMFWILPRSSNWHRHLVRTTPDMLHGGNQKDTRSDAPLSACAQVWEGARNPWALVTHTRMRVGGISNELKGSRFPWKPKGWVSGSSNDHVACRRWLWIQGQRFETIAAFLLQLFLQGAGAAILWLLRGADLKEAACH